MDVHVKENSVVWNLSKSKKWNIYHIGNQINVSQTLVIHVLTKSRKLGVRNKNKLQIYSIDILDNINYE